MGAVPFIKQAAELLGKQTKATILLGKGWRDVGISMELVESNSDYKILDGWSLDVYGSKKRGGLGIAKNIVETEAIEVDAGVYVTKRLKDMLDMRVKPKVSIGLSGKWRF